MSHKLHTASACFTHPEPAPERHAVFPVFIPFSGCRRRCLFCAQETQTGRRMAAVPAILEQAGEALASLREKRAQGIAAAVQGTFRFPAKPLELAFYGGTFTALDEEDFTACLNFGRYWQKQGLILGLRCSTRPDALTPALLADLREAGFTLVELGIQSFSTPALETAGRGYTGEQALAACAMVREAGLGLGIQLMPGMPGVDLCTALADAATAARLRPDCARLYPCLVLEGSELATLWREGAFTPWNEASAVDFLARACLSFWQAGVRVIRMGLAPEEGLTAALLAGPVHPSLGSRARGLALALLIEEHMLKLAPPNHLSSSTREVTLQEQYSATAARFRLTAPRRYQGEFWGFRKELTARYASLGLSPKDVTWGDAPEFFLERIA